MITALANELHTSTYVIRYEMHPVPNRPDTGHPLLTVLYIPAYQRCFSYFRRTYYYLATQLLFCLFALLNLHFKPARFERHSKYSRRLGHNASQESGCKTLHGRHCITRREQHLWLKFRVPAHLIGLVEWSPPRTCTDEKIEPGSRLKPRAERR